MRINQNREISIYRGETAAIDFRISQRTDYYVPFLISSARTNSMVCITIGSTRRESQAIISKQLWLDLADIPKFSQTVIEDLGIPTVSNNTLATLRATLAPMLTSGKMYQFKKQEEVDAGINQLHFVYLDETQNEPIIIDEYHFTITLALDDSITLDMTGVDYYYQIELMDTIPMPEHLINLLAEYPDLLAKLPTNFNINSHSLELIKLVTDVWPDHWGYRITQPLTSPVASVSNIQMIQSPRSFTVHSVVK